MSEMCWESERERESVLVFCGEEEIFFAWKVYCKKNWSNWYLFDGWMEGTMLSFENFLLTS